MYKCLYIILLSLSLVFSGCTSGYDDVSVVKIKDVTYQELRGNVMKLSILITINNSNFFNVKIADANMELRLHDRVIGNVTQVEQIELVGRTEKDYTIYLSIELKDMMTNIINLYRIFMDDPKNLNLSGTVHVKSFMYSKTFKVDRLSFQ